MEKVSPAKVLNGEEKNFKAKLENLRGKNIEIIEWEKNDSSLYTRLIAHALVQGEERYFYATTQELRKICQEDFLRVLSKIEKEHKT